MNSLDGSAVRKKIDRLKKKRETVEENSRKRLSAMKQAVGEEIEATQKTCPHEFEWRDATTYSGDDYRACKWCDLVKR